MNIFIKYTYYFLSNYIVCHTYINPPLEYSNRACGSTNANQSDACVGSNPID